MDGFTDRALELAARIEADPADPRVQGDLDGLRAAWLSMGGRARAEGAQAALRLAAAQARGSSPRSAGPVSPSSVSGLAPAEEVEAQLALKGLDRIGAGHSPARPFTGPRSPEALLEHFGYPNFRPGQREAVEAALEGRDSLVVMPTGGGKSLCYQLPGIASDDLTIVVSPLIALMADQYRRLLLGGHPAVMVASGMEETTVRDALHAVRSGSARIVLCSPERFASASFLSVVSARTVDLFVVDEAHCVSEWGHDFRPDYLRLRAVIDRLGSPPVMACTATATEQVALEIQTRLGLRDPFVVRSGFDRPNLSFDVVALEGAGSRERKHMLLEAVVRGPENRPSIVYCGTRRDVEEVSERLRSAGLQAVGYHAGMPADERASAQHRFMHDDADVVVATNAFGMGVDKADVRSVVHWAIPKSVESYYQEVGRAGRDGHPARAILLAMRADLGRLINFIERDKVEPEEVLAYVGGLRASHGDTIALIDVPSSDRARVCLGVAERAGVCSLEAAPAGQVRVSFASTPDRGRVQAICRVARDRGWRAYRAVEAFTSPTGTCRRRGLLDHFGDRRAGAPAGRCCDVCDPDTIGLPDPGSLTPARPSRTRVSPMTPADPADAGLLGSLRAWRMVASAGKPAYTVAHNRTLESIAATKPATLAQLAAIRGVGPTFVERHGAQVLALVAER